MSRLTDKRLPIAATHAAQIMEAQPEASTLMWRVPARDRQPSFPIDLTAFATGYDKPDARGRPKFKRGRGRPELIGQLAPELRTWSSYAAKTSVDGTLSALRLFWGFLDVIEQRSGGSFDNLKDIASSTGALFKHYMLKELRHSPQHALTCLKQTQMFLEAARRRLNLTPYSLIWPTIIPPRGTIHKDVNPADLRRLYNTTKTIVRHFGAAHAEGIRLLAEYEAATETPDRDSAQHTALRSRGYLSTLLNSEGIRAKRVIPRLEWRCSVRPCSYKDGTPFDWFRWFVPLAEEVAACATLVLLHTGWNSETVFNIDVSTKSAWCQERLTSETGETVALFGNKGKTNREQVAFSLTRPEFHPYRLINDMIVRTTPLRDALRRRLAAIEAKEPTADQLDQILVLKRAIASPWLFLRMTNVDPILGRIGVMDGGTHFIKLFRALAIKAMVIRKLTASDVRDGFAGFLYDNSLFNVLLVKRALGHQNLSATKHYLRQRRMLAERFGDYTAWSEALFDEIKRFQAVDPTILYVRARGGDISEAQRHRLSDHRYRTRMGMGCLDPEHPPASLAPEHGSGLCTVQRCILCHHGVIFRDSFEPLSRRLAELGVIRDSTPIALWDSSSFQAEWIAIEATVARIFPRRTDEFDQAVDDHLARLRAGEGYLFDQIGAGDLALGLP